MNMCEKNTFVKVEYSEVQKKHSWKFWGVTGQILKDVAMLLGWAHGVKHEAREICKDKFSVGGITNWNDFGNNLWYFQFPLRKHKDYRVYRS